MDISKIMAGKPSRLDHKPPERAPRPPVLRKPGNAPPRAALKAGRGLRAPAPEVLERSLLFYRELIAALWAVRDRAVAEGAIGDGELAPLRSLCERLVPILKEAPDPMMACSRRSTPDDYSFGKQANTGVLAGRIAVEMGQTDEIIRKSVLTGWLMHAGTALVERLDLRPRGLSAAEKSAFLDGLRRASPQVLSGAPEAEWVRQACESLLAAAPESGPAFDEDRKSVPPLFCRIIDVASVYEGFTHERPYHEAGLEHEGVKFVVDDGVHRFDPKVIRAFLRSLSVYPPGSFVRTNNGHTAVVIAVSPNLPTRPLIRPLFNETGGPVDDDSPIDLTVNHPVTVAACLGEPEIEATDPVVRLQLMARRWWPPRR